MQQTDHTPTIDPRRTAIVWVGRAVGPLLALTLYLTLGSADELTPQGRATAAIGALIAVFWMTEALPLAVTSLLPIILFPLAGVFSVQEAASPYANTLIFLFMGGFMIALAIERWDLHRRLALHTVLIAGTKPSRLVGGFMIATAGLSMWISNTATAVMMFPIGASVIALLAKHDTECDQSPPTAALGTCLMLAIAYSASIGGVATLIGTPPNLFMASFLEQNYGISLGFARWMLLGAPLAGLFLLATWFLLTRVLFCLSDSEIPGGRALLRSELEGLGRITRGEWTVLIVGGMTALAWIVREPLSNWEWLAIRMPAIIALDDTIIALIGAIALFFIPVDHARGVYALDWGTARKLPWDVLLLFGGGLSLAAAIHGSGLDEWIGVLLGGLHGWHLLALMIAVTTAVIFLTEITSNTATAATFLPIMAGLALSINLDWLLALVVPAALSASFAFMLPVATPPNAIVFGSGYVTVAQMVRAGFWLNILGIILIPLFVYFLGLRVLVPQ